MGERAIQKRSEALPSIERARVALAGARSTHEVRKILVLAQAVASVERGTEVGYDAAELVLDAKARGGELAREIDRTKAGRKGKYVTTGNALSRTARLDQEGLNRKEAAEWQRISELQKSGELEVFQKCSRMAKQQASTRGAVALAKLPESQRRRALAAFGEGGDIRGALNSARRQGRVDHLNELSKAETPLTGAVGTFPILYVDPPWRYEHVETESRAIENQYPTMSLDDICALRVVDLATPDAVLFMWATSPKLAEAMRALDAWGFVYRTCMVWVKDKIGMGYYARQQHELLLIATRGSPPVPAPETRPSSVVEAPRGNKHSAKPVKFYELIERMYPEFKRVELFARTKRDGWSAWGNQAS